jgi:hypothetical protein
VGACRYCPPRYHVAKESGEPYVSQECNHAKVGSIVARWHLLGDWWARQVADEVFNNALTLEYADMAGWRQARGNGHRLRILWFAAHLTGEAKYRQRAEQLMRLGAEHVQKNKEFDKRAKQRFMVGIALEGMIHHYRDRADPAVLRAVQSTADLAYTEQGLKGYTANMAMAFGFCWQQSGNPIYIQALERIIRATGPVGSAKIFGQSFRSAPWAMGYLHQAAVKKVKLPTE